MSQSGSPRLNHLRRRRRPCHRKRTRVTGGRLQIAVGAVASLWLRTNPATAFVRSASGANEGAARPSMREVAQLHGRCVAGSINSRSSGQDHDMAHEGAALRSGMVFFVSKIDDVAFEHPPAEAFALTHALHSVSRKRGCVCRGAGIACGPTLRIDHSNPAVAKPADAPV